MSITTFECSDVKARPAGGDPCQRCSCLALWTWWRSVKRDHDASPITSGGSVTELSVTGSCRDGVVMGPAWNGRYLSAVPFCSLLKKLTVHPYVTVNAQCSL